MSRRARPRPSCSGTLLATLASLLAAYPGPETKAAELAPTEAVRALLEALQPAAARPFSAEAGERLWYDEAPSGRSCTSCHMQSPQVMGRHHKTGEPIEPMARSANADRLTDTRKIRKWLLRNCKWTYGRECTAQEQGDVLLWLSGQ